MKCRYEIFRGENKHSSLVSWPRAVRPIAHATPCGLRCLVQCAYMRLKTETREDEDDGSGGIGA
eukprot:2069103-Prymnesium_polylepis.2